MENKEEKRTLFGIVTTIGVGLGMTANVFQVTERFYGLGQKIAPKIQEYVGSIGSVVAEYGLPVGACVATITLAGLAVIATDKYLLGKKLKSEPAS